MKDFVKWHIVKKEIETSLRRVFFLEREIWWCAVGENVGTEQDGKHERFARPVLVIRKFNSDLFWAIPLTSSVKEGIFYFPLIVHGIQRAAILSQLKTMSSKRLLRRIAKVHPHVFSGLIEKMASLLNKTDPLRGPQVPNGNL